MNTSETRSWKLDGMRLLLDRSLRAWQAGGADGGAPVPPRREQLPTPHPFCDELACGECMLQAG